MELSLSEPSSVSIEDLVYRLLAAKTRGERAKVFPHLVKAATTPNLMRSAFDFLLRKGEDGQRLGLEFAARLPDPIPLELARVVLPLLSAKRVPVLLRILAAAKVLTAVPDKPGNTQPVVRALTQGLNRVRAMDRLLKVQARVEKCDSLDAAVTEADNRVKYKCPKCPAYLKRAEFVGHLWVRHRLVFEDNKARDPHPMVDAAITAAATSANPEDLDRSFLLSRFYYPAVTSRQVFQALAVRGTGDPTLTDLLLEKATEKRAGVCPVCLTAVPDPIPELLPAASVSEGRVAAEGYAVTLRDTPRGRMVTVETPSAADEHFADPGSRRSPRQFAVMIAGVVFFVAVVLMILLPAARTAPLPLAGSFLCLGWFTYVMARFLRKPLPKPTRRVLEITWTELVPGIGKSKAALRFLIRLCRASLEPGDATGRANVVKDLVESAADRADKSPVHQQLFAVARVLEMTDFARMGRERLDGLAEVFEPFFRGEVTPAYAEAAAEVILIETKFTAGDRERFAVILLDMAFAQGFVPSELLLMTRFLPWFRKLLLEWRGDHLAQLHALWRTRTNRTWESSIGPAETVFDLARNDPSLARRLLREKPDALLLLEFRPEVEEVLGAVALTSSGLFLRGVTVSEGRFELVKMQTGALALRVGKQLIGLNGKLSTRLVEQLNEWLQYRAGKVLPAAEQAARMKPGLRVVRALAPLAVACTLCGSYCVHRKGRLGTPWQAIAPTV